jgi:predicted metal-dependent peptidase
MKISKVNVERAIYRLQQEQPFIGGVLQCMNIKVSDQVPTAGVYFDYKVKKFQTLVNPGFFEELSLNQQVALLKHEIYHILYKHVYVNLERFDKMRLNIAMDLVINQKIKNLPKGAMLIENFKDDKDVLFPEDRHFECYYDLLTDDAKTKVPKTPAPGDEENNQEGQESSGGQSNASEDDMKEITVKELLDSCRSNDQVFDVHGWDGDDQATVQDKMEAVKDLIKRAMTKTNTKYSDLDAAVRDTLDEVETQLKKINAKQILMNALRKSMPSDDRKGTWKRPSKRYGRYARGTTVGDNPNLFLLMDTSGSISIEEANKFLGTVNEFMVAGCRKAKLGLFHTDLYSIKNIKKGFKLSEGDIEMGGTDLTSSLSYVIKHKPDLLVILTDGYFGEPKVDLHKLPETVIVVTEGGTEKHGLGKVGRTIKYGL